jgi:diguanylate cyclase (GGDEF)-like protein/PAS domain S-box-containing protein
MSVAELRRHAAFLRAVLEGAADLVFLKDLEGRYQMVNRAFSEFAGKSERELLGRSDHELFPDYHNLPEFLEHDARVLASGRPSSSEYSLEVAGVMRHHLVTKGVYRDEQGNVAGIVGIASEITDRRRIEEALRESEDRYRRIVEASPDGIWVHRGGMTLFANPALVRMLDAGHPAELIGRSVYDFLDPADHANVRGRVEHVERHGRSVAPQVRRLITLKGRTLLTEVAVEPVVWEGQPAVQAVVRDLSTRLRAEEALRESEERYALAAAGANDGLWDWDLRTREMYYSPRLLQMLGLDVGAINASPDEWFGRVHADDVERVRREVAAHLDGDTDHLETSHRVLHSDGSWRWMLARGLAVRQADGRAYRVAGSMTDITALKAAEAQLLHDALHDALTGLPNRALFNEELQLAIDRRRRRPEYGFSVLFLDLDRFKVVNDSLGHLEGDALLKDLSIRLQRCLRPGDRVARLGGDEFTILLDDVEGVSDATRVAERIQEELAAPFLLAGREVFTSASIGIAYSATGYREPEDVLRDADLAMYRAKARGRARYEVFDLAMHATALERLELESDLRRGMERGELRLHYQPVLAVRDQRIIGFEALVRWQHPRRGLVDPAAFIAVAEETNLIVQLGQWVLHEACQRLREWREQFPMMPISMSVNVSGKQLIATALADEVRRDLADYALPASRLQLEITENVLMEDADAAAAALEQLKALGVKIVMDDFGTGYSSLGYLRRFSFDAIKVDREFVMNLDLPENLELVRAVLTLARNLGLMVVAEGVENAEQYLQLRNLDCPYVQGFLFSPAVDAQSATRLLEAQRSSAY